MPFDRTTTIESIKERIAQEFSIPVRNIKLLLGNKELGNGTLEEWHICGGTVLFFDNSPPPEPEEHDEVEYESDSDDEEYI